MTEKVFNPPEGFEEDFLGGKGMETPRWLKRAQKFDHQKKRPTFLELDPRVRRNLAVSMRWRIRTDPNGAGVFYTQDILPGSREWPGEPHGYAVS